MLARAPRVAGASLAGACACASHALHAHARRSSRRQCARVPQALACGLLLDAATPHSSHHIAVHTRTAPPIARDSRYRSPDAHSFQPRCARSRARCACASLPASGAATPARPPSCHGRARGCRSRGSGSREGPERAVRAGGRAGIGASCTLEGRVRGVRARSPFLRAFAPFALRFSCHHHTHQSSHHVS